MRPGSVRMKSRMPPRHNASVLERNRGTSEEAGSVLKATRRIFPRERASSAASMIWPSSIS